MSGLPFSAKTACVCTSRVAVGDGKRRTQLRAWLQAICDCMKGRVFSFNAGTARVRGRLNVICRCIFGLSNLSVRV